MTTERASDTPDDEVSTDPPEDALWSDSAGYRSQVTGGRESATRTAAGIIPTANYDEAQWEHDVREAFALAAADHVGEDVGTSESLRDLIARPDVESPEMQTAMLAGWTCGALAAGVIRAALTELQRPIPECFAAPYKTGRAIVNLLSSGRRADAVRVCEGDEHAPQRGDIVCFGPKEHIAIVQSSLVQLFPRPLSTAPRTPNRLTIETTDGGQIIKSKQGVLARVRVLLFEAGPGVSGDRWRNVAENQQIAWWIDCVELTKGPGR